ncbi:MAG TPA: rhomboid family intramembrane serine protease [Candidatus Eisenbacteria bacterium]|jgi:rhomboid protease GluP|nr:rhomboid family intramembrane serine protease [Candidatus Eisenbacteria bacterium]
MSADPHAGRFFPWATYGLLAALAVMFAVELATGRAGSESALLALGAAPNRPTGEYWRFITYSFLHLNWNHIVMNSVLLWWTGRIVERRAGAAQMLLVYFVAVLFAGAALAIQAYVHPRDGASVGASGGAFGLLAAALLLAHRADAVAAFGDNPKMRMGLWMVMAISLYITFQPGVSVAGHAGGLIAGLTLGMLIRVHPVAPAPASA